MQIDQDYFRSLLQETIDENPLACRAVLSLCRVEFTKSVETLAVSLGKPSVLHVNLGFLERHCETEKHVKAVLIHEFLHILLGHTLKFKKMTPALNVALDAVINAIIHRRLGAEYSSMMAAYYRDAQGLLALLRPMDEAARHQANLDYINNRYITDPLTQLHASLYNGKALADDVLSIAHSFVGKGLKLHLKGRPVLIGDHDRDPSEFEKLEATEERKLKQALVVLDAAGVFRDPNGTKPQILRQTPVQKSVPASWRAQTLPVLRRLIVPDPRSRLTLPQTRTHLAPVLNTSDRRGTLRAMWSPLIPEIAWNTVHPRPAGSVQIYLDVSGSMNTFLDALIALLAGFSSHIRQPLWAFSTEVHPARIVAGELQTSTTGGTMLGCVYQHIRQTRPEKALIVTDGFVEDSSAGAKPRELCAIEALIPHDGYDTILVNQHKIPTTRLSKLPSAALLAS
jgi:hypothetical protein